VLARRWHFVLFSLYFIVSSSYLKFTPQDVIAEATARGGTPSQIATSLQRWREGVEQETRSTHGERDPERWVKELDKVNEVLAPHMQALYGAASEEERQSAVFRLPKTARLKAPMLADDGQQVGAFDLRAKPGGGFTALLYSHTDEVEEGKRAGLKKTALLDLPEPNEEAVTARRAALESEAAENAAKAAKAEGILQAFDEAPVYGFGGWDKAKERGWNGERGDELRHQRDTGRRAEREALLKLDQYKDPATAKMAFLSESVIDGVKKSGLRDSFGKIGRAHV
jgi:hypothetical protein